MNEPKIDPEKLAALLDGRLSDAEREELIARLAASEAELEAYVDAVAVMHELEAEGVGGEAHEAGAGESTEARSAAAIRRFVQSPRRLAMAAAIAAVALAPVLWWQSRAPASLDPGQLAALLAPGSVPADGYAPLWSTTRGTGDTVTPPARAARLGVRLVDLEVAVRSRDSAAVVMVAREIASLLDGMTAGGPAATVYRQIARDAAAPPAALAELLERGHGAATALVDRELFALAAWAEAGRLAAARRDADFFSARGIRRMLERYEGVALRSPDARDALADATARIRAGDSDTIDWSGLEHALTALVRTATE